MQDYFNKINLEKIEKDEAQYVIHLDQKSGLITSIQRLDQLKYGKIPEKNNEKFNFQNKNVNYQDTLEYNKKKFGFINENIFYGKFEGWFISQSLIIFLNLSIYLLWKISDQSESTNLKKYLEKYFTQFNTEKIDQDLKTTQLSHFPNIILSGFSHQSFTHLLCNVGILLLFARRIHEHLGALKFWSLYLGGISAGYIYNCYNTKLQPSILSQDNLVRRWNIVNGQNLGFSNLRSDGASDGIMALVIYSYSSLAQRSFVFPQRLYMSALLLFPLYFLEDFSNYFYPKKDLTESHTNKPHFGGCLFGLSYYLVSQMVNGTLLSGLDKRKLSLINLSLIVYVVWYWYLNEIEYAGLRQVENLSKSKYDVIINIQNFYLSQMFEQFEVRNIIGLDLKKLKNTIKDQTHFSQSQLQYGDQIFVQLKEIVQNVQQEKDKQYIISSLRQNNQLQYIPLKEAKLQRQKTYLQKSLLI